MGSVSIEIRDRANNIFGVVDIGESTESPFTVKKAISDLQDISKRGGSFSYNFKIPGNERNNILFERMFDANIVNQNNILADHDAIIFDDGLQVETGKLRIEKTNLKGDYDDKLPEYEIKFYGSNSAWKVLLDDAVTADLPWATGVVPYTPATVKNSWSNTFNDEYVFSLINRGQKKLQDSVHTEDFLPDLFWSKWLEKCMQFAGFSFESDLFTNQSLSTAITSHFGKNFRIVQKTLDVNFVRTRLNQTITQSYSILAGTSESKEINCTGILLCDNWDDTYADGSDQSNNMDLRNWTAPFNCLVEFTFISEITVVRTSGTPNGISRGRMVLRVERFGGGTEFIPFLQDAWAGATTTPLTATGPFKSGEILVNEFDRVYIEHEVDGTNILGNVNIDVTFNFPETVLEVDISPKIVEGYEFDFKSILDDEVPVIDIISDLTKAFNLYWWTDNDIKRVYCETRDDFYDQNVNAVDLTERVDKSKKMVITPNPRLFTQELTYSYSEDSEDEPLINLNKQNEYSHGAYHHKFNENFTPGNKEVKLETISATIEAVDFYANDNTNPSPILAKMWQKDSVNPPLVNQDFKPRILSYRFGSQVDTSGLLRTFRFYDELTDRTNIPYSLPRQIISGATIQAPTDENYWFSSTQNQEGLVPKYYGDTMRTIEDGQRLVLNLQTDTTDYKYLDFRTPVYFKEPSEIEGYWIIEACLGFKIGTNGSYKWQLLRKKRLSSFREIDQIPNEQIINIPRAAFIQGNEDSPNLGNRDTPSFVLSNGSRNSALKGSQSFVAGYELKSEGDKQIITGRYNEPNSTDSWQLGNGESEDSRNNAVSLAGNTLTTKGVEVIKYTDKIEGGVDEVQNPFGPFLTNQTNRIVGGVDQVQGLGSSSPVNRIIAPIDSV